MNKIRDFFLTRDKYLLSIISVLFVIRMAIPYTIYAFLFASVIYFISFIVFRSGELKKSFVFIKWFWRYLLLLFFFMFGLIQTEIITFNLLKEVLNAIVLFFLAFFWFIALYNKKVQKSYFEAFTLTFLVFSLLASIAGIGKFLLELANIKLGFLEYHQYSISSSIVNDNNYFALAILFGVFILLKYMINNYNLFYRLVLQVALFVSSIAIFLSISRRGIIILLTIYLFLFISTFISFFYKKSTRLRNIVRNSIPVILSFLSFLSLMIFLIVFISPQLKTKLINKYNLNLNTIRTGTNSVIYSYGTILNSDISYKDIDSFIWKYNVKSQKQYNPNFPELYFEGLNSDKFVYPLNNPPKEISVISGGLIVNSESNSFLWYAENNIPMSYTSMSSPTFELKKDVPYSASVYCFVSEKCNLNYVELRISSKEKIVDSYDLGKKGAWYKLNYQFQATVDTSVNIILFTAKYNEINYSNIEGYVLFVLPKLTIKDGVKKEIEIENSDQNDLFVDLVYKVRGYFDKRILDSKIVNSYQSEHGNIYLEASRDIYKIFRADTSNIHAKMQLKNYLDIADFKKQNKVYWERMDSFSSTSLLQKEIVLLKKQPVKKHDELTNRPLRLGELIENSIISEDTINKIIGENEANYLIINKLYGERVERWKYAFKLFITEFSFFQKIFGDGFDYQRKFGSKFLGDDKVDYPHNVVISSLLYSGLIGAGFYIYFLIYICLVYLKNIKKEPHLFLIFIVTLFYSLTSSNSHFDSTFLALLCIFPFVLNIEKK